MPSDLLHVKAGLNDNSLVTRTIRLLRGQSNVVYDLYNIHYSFLTTVFLSVNNFAFLCLSTRALDQVNEDRTVTLREMSEEEGLFASICLVSTDDTGSGGIVGAHDIAFTKPYTVPWLALAVNMSWPNGLSAGVEVWFTRRNEQPMEKAGLVARLGGGRALTE